MKHGTVLRAINQPCLDELTVSSVAEPLNNNKKDAEGLLDHLLHIAQTRLAAHQPEVRATNEVIGRETVYSGAHPALSPGPTPLGSGKSAEARPEPLLVVADCH